MINRLDRAGVYTCVAHGIDRAIACLEGWGLLKGKASLRAESWDRMWQKPFDLTDSEKAELD
jgi:hypothetical protein